MSIEHWHHLQVHAFEHLQAQSHIELEPPAVTAGATALAKAGQLDQAEALLVRHSVPGLLDGLLECLAES